MIPAIIMGAMAGMQLLGGMMQAQQMKAAGGAAKAAGRFQQQLAESRAQALETQAGQELAASQRAMMAERQQGNLISGRARALAAASGASMASPSIVQGLADIAGSEDYRVGMTKYQGESQANALRYGAAVERAGGTAARQAGSFQNRLSNAQANAALLNSTLNAGMMGMSAYGMAKAPTSAPASNTPAVPAPGGATMGGYEMGWSNTPSMLQQGSPMFLRYGMGGP